MFKHFKKDFPASIIVFLVAVPLCLGIAVASEAPALSGIIGGIIGGIVVGTMSNSALGVSGPAAGLAAIVATSITKLGEGGFELFLVAVVIGGIIQLILGFLKGGVVGYYFPNSVILGMLGGIGVVIFMKQIPNIIGIKGNTKLREIVFNFSDISEYITPGSILICLLSIGILALWERPFMKKKKAFSLIQGPLVVVVLGILLNEIFLQIDIFKYLAIENEKYWNAEEEKWEWIIRLVNLPIADNLEGFKNFFAFFFI